VNLLASMFDFLADNGGAMLLGCTMVLAGGALTMLWTRAPAARRTLGIATGLGVLVYLLLAVVPLPRWQLPKAAESAPMASPPASEITEDPAARAALELSLMPRSETATDGSPAARGARALLPGPQPQPQPPLPWAGIATAVFLAGAAIAALRLLLGALALRRIVVRSEAAPPWLAAAAGVPARVRVLLAAAAVRPFCCGVWRGTIVLPAELGAPERRAQAIAVLRHEQAHLAARDVQAQWLFAALLPLLWWQPLFHWLRTEVRFCGELLADADAARTGVAGYVRELLDLQQEQLPLPRGQLAVSVFHRPSEFYRRIHMLLNRERPLSSSTSRLRRIGQALSTTALVAVCAGFFGAAPARAQDPDEPGVRRENRALRNTINEMRQQIDELRRRVEAVMRSRATDSDTQPLLPDDADAMAPARVPILRDVPMLGDLFETRRAPPGSPPPDALAPAPALPPVALPETAPSQPFQGEVFMPGVAPVTTPLPPQPSQRSPKAPKAPRGRKPGQPAAPPPGTTAPDLPAVSETTELFGVVDPVAPPALPRPRRESSPDPLGSFDLLPETGADRAPESNGPVFELCQRLIDLQAEVETAEITAAETRQLSESGSLSTSAAATAAAKLRAAKKKLAIAQRLFEGELTACRAEVAALQADVDRGEGAERRHAEVRLHRARARLEALEATR
jgi:beta-lactamase regulating signal transducer with metallopeptidase domain